MINRMIDLAPARGRAFQRLAHEGLDLGPAFDRHGVDPRLADPVSGRRKAIGANRDIDDDAFCVHEQGQITGGGEKRAEVIGFQAPRPGCGGGETRCDWRGHDVAHNADLAFCL